MNIEIILKSVGAFVGIIGAGRIIYEILNGHKSKLREEYIFAKSFIQDLADKEMHPFLREKGFQALAGTTEVNAEDVDYILTLENPAQSLSDYVFSRQYLGTIRKTGKYKIDFSLKYESNWSRSWRKIVYLVLYVFYAALAISPFLLAKPMHASAVQMFTYSLFTIPLLGFLAIDSLKSFTKIYRSELLVKNQLQRAKKIVAIE